MGKEQGLKDCVKYFKSNPGFKRLLEGFREKYASLGHVGGNVVLENLTDDEAMALRGLLQKDFSGSNAASVSAAQFEKALSGTKFAGYPLIDILEGYFGTKMIGKREQRDAWESEQKDFFHEVLSGLDRDIGRQWLEHVLLSKEKPYAQIMQSYKKDRQELAKRMYFSSKALDWAADHKERGAALRLPVFAAGITGNPHYFDEGSEAGRMLTAGLCFLLQMKEPANAEEKAELFYQGGIIKDDISNFTVTYGLVLAHAGGTAPSGTEPPIDKAPLESALSSSKESSKADNVSGASFVKAYEPLHLSLSNISRAKDIALYDAGCHRVYVVENPAVFSAVLDDLRAKGASSQIIKYPALVCVSGQPRLASLLLLDRLAQKGCTIWYAGDFDPEGLMMADRLKKRYGQNLTLWRYTAKDYENALSEEILSSSRIKKLDKIADDSLRHVADQISAAKQAGYQEHIIEAYLQDIRDFTGSH